MTSSNRAAFAWSLLLLAACSGREPVGEAPSAILGGAPDPGDPAVVLLASYPQDHSTSTPAPPS